MIIPLRTNGPHRAHPATRFLVAVNILVYGAMLIRPGVLEEDWALTLGQLASPSLLTYMFLHANLMHVVGNLIFLVAFGRVVEDRLGPWKFLLLFLAGGCIAGAFWNVFAEPFELEFYGTVVCPRLVGASGAVSALTGAALALAPHAAMEGLVFFLIFIQRIVLPLWVWAVFFFAMDYLNFFSDLFGAGGQNSQVAYSAHVGGFAFGYLAVRLFRRRKVPASIPAPSVELTGQDLLRMGLASSANVTGLLTRALDMGISAGDVLAMARSQAVKGGAVSAYTLLQGYIELRPGDPRCVEMAHELALLAFRELQRPDLAVEWARFGLSRSPEGPWADKLQSILQSLS
ncbi:MAG: rhomboid family intramembrane serine protease [Planctomycetota bacterium]